MDLNEKGTQRADLEAAKNCLMRNRIVHRCLLWSGLELWPVATQESFDITVELSRKGLLRCGTE